MKKLVFLLLIASFLLQSAVKTVLVIEWKVYQKEITELYCINKNKPEMQCNGRCHLAMKMRRIEADYEQSKRPFTPKHTKPIDFVLFCQHDFPESSNEGAIASLSLRGGFYHELKAQATLNDLFDPPRIKAA